MRRVGFAFAIGILLSALSVSPAFAQASISGVVQDASGAVLPGVTVEATSPALIEKMRAAVTDGSGRYSIVDLRPGTYEVSFSLAGFSTIKREGVLLSGNFDAPVNAELRVGSLEETITVSGASPVVDVTNTLTQTVLTKEQIEVLPGGRTIQGRAALVPGVMVTSANTGVIAHGSASTDSHTMIDGYKSGMHLVGRGTGRLGVGSVTQTQEATIEELGVRRQRTGRRIRLQRRADEHDPEGGQQRHPVRNHFLREPGDLRDEQSRGSAGSLQLPVRAAGVLLRLQLGGRRPAQAGQAVVLRLDRRQSQQHANPRYLLQAG